jgi:hypothetical protein
MENKLIVTYNKNSSAGKGYGNMVGTCGELDVNTLRT